MTGRLTEGDRVTDMMGRDGVVAAIDASQPVRIVTVRFDLGGTEELPEGMLEKRPGWGTSGRAA